MVATSIVHERRSYTLSFLSLLFVTELTREDLLEMGVSEELLDSFLSARWSLDGARAVSQTSI